MKCTMKLLLVFIGSVGLFFGTLEWAMEHGVELVETGRPKVETEAKKQEEKRLEEKRLEEKRVEEERTRREREAHEVARKEAEKKAHEQAEKVAKEQAKKEQEKKAHELQEAKKREEAAAKKKHEAEQAAHRLSPEEARKRIESWKKMWTDASYRGVGGSGYFAGDLYKATPAERADSVWRYVNNQFVSQELSPDPSVRLEFVKLLGTVAGEVARYGPSGLGGPRTSYSQIETLLADKLKEQLETVLPETADLNALSATHREITAAFKSAGDAVKKALHEETGKIITESFEKIIQKRIEELQKTRLTSLAGRFDEIRKLSDGFQKTVASFGDEALQKQLSKVLEEHARPASHEGLVKTFKEQFVRDGTLGVASEQRAKTVADVNKLLEQLRREPGADRSLLQELEKVLVATAEADIKHSKEFVESALKELGGYSDEAKLARIDELTSELENTKKYAFDDPRVRVELERGLDVLHAQHDAATISSVLSAGQAGSVEQLRNAAVALAKNAGAVVSSLDYTRVTETRGATWLAERDSIMLQQKVRSDEILTSLKKTTYTVGENTYNSIQLGLLCDDWLNNNVVPTDPRVIELMEGRGLLESVDGGKQPTDRAFALADIARLGKQLEDRSKQIEEFRRSTKDGKELPGLQFSVAAVPISGEAGRAVRTSTLAETLRLNWMIDIDQWAALKKVYLDRVRARPEPELTAKEKAERVARPAVVVEPPTWESLSQREEDRKKTELAVGLKSGGSANQEALLDKFNEIVFNRANRITKDELITSTDTPEQRQKKGEVLMKKLRLNDRIQAMLHQDDLAAGRPLSEAERQKKQQEHQDALLDPGATSDTLFWAVYHQTELNTQREAMAKEQKDRALSAIGDMGDIADILATKRHGYEAEERKILDQLLKTRDEKTRAELVAKLTKIREHYMDPWFESLVTLRVEEAHLTPAEQREYGPQMKRIGHLLGVINGVPGEVAKLKPTTMAEDMRAIFVGLGGMFARGWDVMRLWFRKQGTRFMEFIGRMTKKSSAPLGVAAGAATYLSLGHLKDALVGSLFGPLGPLASTLSWLGGGGANAFDLVTSGFAGLGTGTILYWLGNKIEPSQEQLDQLNAELDRVGLAPLAASKDRPFVETAHKWMKDLFSNQVSLWTVAQRAHEKNIEFRTDAYAKAQKSFYETLRSAGLVGENPTALEVERAIALAGAQMGEQSALARVLHRAEYERRYQDWMRTSQALALAQADRLTSINTFMMHALATPVQVAEQSQAAIPAVATGVGVAGGAALAFSVAASLPLLGLLAAGGAAVGLFAGVRYHGEIERAESAAYELYNAAVNGNKEAAARLQETLNQTYEKQKAMLDELRAQLDNPEVARQLNEASPFGGSTFIDMFRSIVDQRIQTQVTTYRDGVEKLLKERGYKGLGESAEAKKAAEAAAKEGAEAGAKKGAAAETVAAVRT